MVLDKRSEKWKTIIRDGEKEHVCEHGIGHWHWPHSCDGCCKSKTYPGRENEDDIDVINEKIRKIVADSHNHLNDAKVVEKLREEAEKEKRRNRIRQEDYFIVFDT
jgi:hypothetical protein